MKPQLQHSHEHEIETVANVGGSWITTELYK